MSMSRLPHPRRPACGCPPSVLCCCALHAGEAPLKKRSSKKEKRKKATWADAWQQLRLSPKVFALTTWVVGFGLAFKVTEQIGHPIPLGITSPLIQQDSADFVPLPAALLIDGLFSFLYARSCWT